jgi:hypothetical protein
LAEPITVATDVALAGGALALAVLLLRSARPLPRARRLWALAFLLTAVGAATGATRHALLEETASVARSRLWLATYLVLGVANLAFLAGLARALLPARLWRTVLGVLLARAALYSVLLVAAPSARLVIGDFALSIAAILALALRSLLVTREGAGAWLLAGLAVSAAGAFVQALPMGPLGIFNHDDMFHVIQMAGLWLFYRAALHFREPDGHPETEAAKAS